MTTPTAPAGSPLSEADFLAFRLGAERQRKLKRAARVASFSALSILALAPVAALLTIFAFSLWSLIITVALAVVGAVEFRGHKQLLRAEPAACRTLALNQLALLALILLYCLWQMLTFSTAAVEAELRSPAAAPYLDAVRQSLGVDPLAELGQTLRLLPAFVYVFYTLVMLLSLLYFGGLALYYRSRRRLVEDFRRDTPDWVRRQLADLEQ